MTNTKTDVSALVTVAVEAQTECAAAGIVRDRANMRALTAFETSALATSAARKGGAKDVTIAAAFRKARAAHVARLVAEESLSQADAEKVTEPLYLTSNPAIGYHGRTGDFLILPGDMPEGMTAPDVQTLVRKVACKAVDKILAAEGQTKDGALSALNEAATPTEAPVEPETKPTEGKTTPSAAKDAEALLTAMSGTLAKVAKMDAGMWTPEALKIADAYMLGLHKMTKAVRAAAEPKRPALRAVEAA